jgi:hypothetical protein
LQHPFQKETQGVDGVHNHITQHFGSSYKSIAIARSHHTKAHHRSTTIWIFT